MSMNHIRAGSVTFVRVWLATIIWLTLASAANAAAPQTFTLDVKDGKLAGSGADLIRNELAKEEFILWGEEHGFADSPIVLRAIARDARPLGFKYHVVEVGPLSTRMIRETLSHDGVPGLHKIVQEVP